MIAGITVYSWFFVFGGVVLVLLVIGCLLEGGGRR